MNPSAVQSKGHKKSGFTLIELLVVLGILGILSTTLLPALCATKSQSKTTACAARFRQWAIAANLYAKDNLERLPSFTVSGGGSYAWDVGTNMFNALGVYGMAVPDWFCPMRPAEMEAANSWAVAYSGHPLQNIGDLTQYFSRSYPGDLILNDNYWVPRTQSGTSFPIDYSNHPQIIWPVWIKQGMPTSAIYGWPVKLHDNAAAHVPFVSDKCGSGDAGGLNSPSAGSPNVSNIAPNTAHFVNGQLIGVNLAFTDGHVESHNSSQMRAVYASTGGGTYWFY